MSHGLGRHQRRVLEDMYRHGGVYPPSWHIKSSHRHIFESLVQRGLVTHVVVDEVETYRMTEPS